MHINARARLLPVVHTVTERCLQSFTYRYIPCARLHARALDVCIRLFHEPYPGYRWFPSHSLSLARLLSFTPFVIPNSPFSTCIGVYIRR